MLKVAISVMLLLTSQLGAAEDDDIDNALNSIESPLFVSLGSHCEASGLLRENKLRKVAFPFDWMETSNTEKFLTIFQDDFRYFLDQRYFVRNPRNPWFIEHTYYHIEFRHDGPPAEFMEHPNRYAIQFEHIDKKYARRITRFRQIRNYEGKVVFIRTAFDFNNDPYAYWGSPEDGRITYEQALALKLTLDQYFPTVDFVLAIVNYADEPVPQITGIDGVYEFKVRRDHKGEDYRALFQTFKQ